VAVLAPANAGVMRGLLKMCVQVSRVGIGRVYTLILPFLRRNEASPTTGYVPEATVDAWWHAAAPHAWQRASGSGRLTLTLAAPFKDVAVINPPSRGSGATSFGSAGCRYRGR
jgi:hypothetical protein